MNIRDTIKQSGAALIMSNVTYMLSFLGSLILMRMLSPVHFGQVAIALGASGLVEMISTLSLNTVVLQRRQTRSLLRAVYQLAIASLVVRFAIGCAVALWVTSRFDPIIRDLFLVLLLSKLTTGFGAIMTAQMFMQGAHLKATAVMCASNLTAIAAAILAVWFGYGVYGLVLREALPPVLLLGLCTGLAAHLAPRNLAALNRRQLWVTGRSAMELYVQRAAEIGFMRLPLLAIEGLFGPAALGLFAQSTYLVTSVNRITSVLNQQIATAFLSTHCKTGALAKQGNRYLVGIAVGLGAPVSAAMFWWSDPIVATLWGEDWRKAAPILQAMAPLALILPLFTILKSNLTALRRNGAITWAYFIGSCAILLALPLVAQLDGGLGLIGIASLASYGVTTTFVFAAVWRCSVRRSPSRPISWSVAKC